jgi:hypothetical protein
VVKATDLKSVGISRAGSNPAGSEFFLLELTIFDHKNKKTMVESLKFSKE